jgi:predicted Fe-Mo cluster-binding NifX family protein
MAGGLKNMKIAIATTGKNESSEISFQAGRAPYYLIFNEKIELLEEVSNPFFVGGGGAGFAVAKMLADKGVNIMVAGEIGDNMKNALNQKGINYYQKQGIAEEVAKEIVNLEK